MTEALRRASCIPYDTAKYMVLPDERANQLAKKLKSPMFAQWFSRDKWQVIYYDSLRDNLRSLKRGKKQLGDVVGLLAKQRPRKADSSKQLGLL